MDDPANVAITFSQNFSFGDGTTSASLSSASTAFGLNGGDSIFGGNADTTAGDLDTYVFTYDPGTEADNLTIPAGTDLGGGELATGLTGGSPGEYAVFATWPITDNVSGGDTTYTIATMGDEVSVTFSQNNLGDAWVKIGTINWTDGDIVLTQEAGANTFVSMRSAGVLFEPVPEPATTAFVCALVAFGAVWWRRRRV